MEQIQPLQSLADNHTTLQDTNLLSAEMECQISLTSISFRASPRRHVGAYVLSAVEIGCADEPRIPGEERWITGISW